MPYNVGIMCNSVLVLAAWANQPVHWWIESDWWLVGIGAVTAAVICWQSWETRKAAQASKASVAMVLSKERARLTIKVWRHLWRQSGAIGEHLVAPAVEFQVMNWGPTHAFNLRLLLSYIATESDLPTTLPEMEEIPLRETTLVGGKDRHIAKGLELKNIGGIIQGRMSVQLGGKLTYDDVFGESRVTTFRYILAQDKHTRHGSPDENLEN